MKKLLTIIKVVTVEFIISIILLLILAFGMYRLGLNEQWAKYGIIVVYAIATFIGGIIIGKVNLRKKFLWGLCAGGIYFVVLLLISIVLKSTNAIAMGPVVPLVCCSFFGMLGGMLCK